MPFDHKAGPSRVYKYGCKGVSSPSPVLDQVYLAHRYRAAVVEGVNWRQRQERPDTENAASDFARAGTHNLAAVGRLALLLRQGVAECREVPAATTTRECQHCGHVNDWDRAVRLEQTCAGCGATWDQDQNAAVVIRRRGERGGGPTRERDAG